MSYLSNLPRELRFSGERSLQEAADVRLGRQQRYRNHFVAVTQKSIEAQSALFQEDGRLALAGDRRKICQRILRKPVLVDFRSGVHRRCRNLREDDMVEHVSVSA
ncbi:MAG TPA: hypothetical protein DE312_10090 [Gallionella sp.]|nr:MAG: hypothetical protein A2Z87_12175 [Gallionellales bacterium GWA2_54_124]OGT19159.1 MAG: hypothetical protein A2522_05940 [Gallionellales bacterium RIFOXYD12_FULL_53_10]HCI53645.1 hypothetical protein [Gallionella sp.]